MLNTYVTRINGQSGPSSPFMPDNHIVIDAGNIRRQGTSGEPVITIRSTVNAIASAVRPLFVENITGDDYEVILPNGITI